MTRIPPVHAPLPRRCGRAFTLIELLVAMVVLAILAVLSFQVIRLTNGVWTSTNSKVSQFREARVAFEALTLRLGGATLAPYLAYRYETPAPAPPGAAKPTQYGRHSELRFLSGRAAQVVGGSNHPTHAVFFTAPLGYTNAGSAYARLPGLLNVCGYYVEWSNVDPDTPAIIAAARPGGTYRFRLMQFLQPAENMALYGQTAQGYDTGYAPASVPGWQNAALQATPQAARPLCDNVVALILLPCRSLQDTTTTLAPNFLYDSESTNPADAALDQQNRLPLAVRVILYSIDEASARKLGASATMPDLYTSDGALFTDPARLYPDPGTGDIGDVGRFEAVLTARRLTYLRHETVVQLAPQPWNTQPYY